MRLYLRLAPLTWFRASLGVRSSTAGAVALGVELPHLHCMPGETVGRLWAGSI